MRKVLALGAAVLFIGSVGVAGAQERLPQSSSGSGFGVGAGVGRCFRKLGSHAGL